MITHYIPWMNSSSSWRASRRNSVPSPGLPNPRFEAWEQATAAWAETVVSASTTRPRARDGSRPVTVIGGSRKNSSSKRNTSRGTHRYDH
jgi:hypothetical protein